MAPSIFAADTTTATVPGFSTNPYLRVYYGGKYNTGPRLKSGDGIHLQADSSNNITITSTFSSSVTKLYYNGTSDTSVYVSLNLSQPAYLIVSHTKGGCEWVLYLQKSSGAIPSIIWGYGSSSLGYCFENQLPEKGGQLVAGMPTSDYLGGVRIGYSKTGSLMPLSVDSAGKAYTDVGSNIQYSVLSSIFGSGTGGLIRVNDTANNNRYLFIFGRTAALSDGESSTWNYPTAITSASPSKIEFSFTQIGTASPIQWQNAIIITSLTTSACTIRNNTGSTCNFSFIGIARW